jgi:hypothetical protein
MGKREMEGEGRAKEIGISVLSQKNKLIRGQYDIAKVLHKLWRGILYFYYCF